MKLINTATIEAYEIDGKILYKMKLGDETILATAADDEVFGPLSNFLDCIEDATSEPDTFEGEPPSIQDVADAIEDFMFADDESDEEREAAFRVMQNIVAATTGLRISPQHTRGV